MPKISVIVGTRPEAIKMAPVILDLQSNGAIECEVCATAQHREMLDQALDSFGITPDVDLDLMRPGQTLADFTARAVTAVSRHLETSSPDMVLVQGDTTTVLSAALSCFYAHVPLGHVEAGLRTGDLQSPWPEEANRVLTSRLTTLHFAPTAAARDNLVRERVDDRSITVTGNTVIDALLITLSKTRGAHTRIPGLVDDIASAWNGAPMVLITGHRRESFGPGFESICRAIARLARAFPETQFVYPVHLNPNVREPVGRILGDGNDSLPNVHLIEPISYVPFVALMDRAKLILTDSGGIQEEAPSLGRPVLVMRDTTERPEAVEAGTVVLVGTVEKKIVDEASKLMTDEDAYGRMARAHNPYGDGEASPRIRQAIGEYFETHT